MSTISSSTRTKRSDFAQAPPSPPSPILHSLTNAAPDDSWHQTISWLASGQVNLTYKNSIALKSLSLALTPFLQPPALDSLPQYSWVGSGEGGKHRVIVNACKEQIPAVINAFYALAWRAWCLPSSSEPQNPAFQFTAAEAAFNAVRASACTPAVLRDVLAKVDIREAWDEICASANMKPGSPYTEAGVESTGLVVVEEWLLHCARDPRAFLVYNRAADPWLRDWGLVERQWGVLGGF